MTNGARLSVVLCTHNPRSDYLRECLAGLQLQTLSQEHWEFVLVDNGSTPPLQGSITLNWHSNARIVREEILGLTAARLRGIAETSGELIVFLDDDNILDADYLAVALQVANEKPFLGSWSGQCRPLFERAPEHWTQRYWGNLVIREFDQDSWSNDAEIAETMPCGAGLCVRRPVAQSYVQLHEKGERRVQLDRTGKSLLSGGDNDLAASACDIGLGLGIISRLKLTHLIPADRLTLGYLTRLVEGIYFSAVVLAYFRGWTAREVSYRVRWKDRIRARLAGRRHSAIQRAVLRGREKGLKLVADLRQGSK